MIHQSFATKADSETLERTANALRENGFAVEILDDALAARTRVQQLIPPGVTVFTTASETLHVVGIESDINGSDKYDAVKPRVWSLDRQTQADEIRRLLATPDVAIGSVAAITEDGSVFAVSASGSQLPAYAGGAARVILIVGAQKIVADHATALERITNYILPLENERTLKVYGASSAVNKVLITNREFVKGRTTVLLLREAIGY